MSTVTSATPPRTRASRKEILGWAMFDFANQAYTLLIITVVFGELFTTVIVGDRGDGYRLANLDRKSTRLNSSHVRISYAVFCLKKKKSKSRPHKHTVSMSF